MKEHSFEVTKKDAGTRVDKWLTTTLNLPRNQVKALLDNGRVLVNNRRVVIAGWELEPFDHVLVRIPKERAHAAEQADAAPAKKTVQRRPPVEHRPVREGRRSALRNIGKPTLSYEKEQALNREAQRGGGKKREAKLGSRSGEPPKRLTVHFHDKHLIVVDKPAGLLTIQQKGSEHPSLVGQVKAFLRRKYPGAKHSFVQPLHRLDSDTSGVLVLALSKAGEKLEQQFRDHTISRRYVACVHGAMEKEQGVIDAPIEKGRFGRGRKVRVAKGEGGRAARTEYYVKERYANASLIDVTVITGRTHQVRVHLASKNHPLIGDKTYSDNRRESIPFGRHALHASSLGFKHPVSGQKMSFSSPLPDDMKQLIDKLRTG